MVVKMMNGNMELTCYANNVISNLAKKYNIGLPDIPKYIKTVRYNMSIPTMLKVFLMKMKDATGTPMNHILTKALIEYALNHGISETDMNIITLNRDEYLELISRYEELKRDIQRLSKISKELDKKDAKIKELTNLLSEVIKENKKLKRDYKKLNTQLKNTENKLKMVMKKDPILNLKNHLDEQPENTEFPLTEVFKHLRITHRNDKMKFLDKNLKQDDELSTNYLKVYTFMDDRLSDYLLFTENDIFNGSITAKSNLKNILARIDEKIKRQKELEKLKTQMKSYVKPIELELAGIMKKHPELSEPILEYIAKLNRCETPQQLINLVNEIGEWLKQYSITLSKDVIEEVSNSIKADELERNNPQELLRDSD